MDAKMLNRARGTRVFAELGVGSVRYHNTNVVAWNERYIFLKTGGWQTVTTKRRMNQAADVFGLGYRVYQEDYRFYVDYRGKTYSFPVDGKVTLRRES